MALGPVFMSGALLVSDLFAISLAVLSGFHSWQYLNPAIPSAELYVLALAVGFSIANLAFKGLYPGIGLTSVAQMRHIGHGITLAYLLLAASMVLVKGWSQSSRGAVLTAWVLSMTFVMLSRWAAGVFLSGRAWWGVPVVILGAGETASLVIRNMKANPEVGFRPVVCLDDDYGKHGSCEGVPVTGALPTVGQVAAETGARYAIVAMPSMPRERLVRHLRHWSVLFPNIVLVPNLLGVASLWVEPRDLAGILGLEIRHNLLNPFNRWLKRAMDIVFAGLGLIAAGPIMAVAVLWIKRVSPGSAFYTQEREGKNGQAIGILKLRTMSPNAEAMLQEHLTENAAARAEWARYCKLKNDPRILPGIGALLRKTSMDELPQLWNILRGEMSLVGPRPFPAYHNQMFDPEFRKLRTQVTPGLTGLWQISARSDGDLTVQEWLDSYYIRNWSPWLDLYILVRTIRTVMVQHGAY